MSETKHTCEEMSRGSTWSRYIYDEADSDEDDAYPCGDERVVLVTVLRDGVEQHWSDR